MTTNFNQFFLTISNI